jgi:hypothetical protein
VPFIGDFSGYSSSFSNEARFLALPSSVHGAIIGSEMRIRESGWRVREDVAATERNKSEAAVENAKLMGRLVDENIKTKGENIETKAEEIDRLKEKLNTVRKAKATVDPSKIFFYHCQSVWWEGPTRVVELW